MVGKLAGMFAITGKAVGKLCALLDVQDHVCL
jgi:hypothetical protein